MTFPVYYQGLRDLSGKTSVSEGSSIAVSTLQPPGGLAGRVAWRFQQAQRSGRLTNLGNLLADTLGARITTLETALGNFSFPKSGTVFANARLVTPAADGQTELGNIAGRISAQVHTADEASRYYKFFSTGRDGSRPTSLAGTEYSFDISLGEVTDSVTLRIASDADWGTVLHNVASAINASTPHVQAEVVTQSAPYSLNPLMGTTGSALAVTVAPGHADQDLVLTDTTNHLLKGLNLRATDAPSGAATIARYDVRDTRRAQQASFHSAVFDPNALSGLAAGIHKFSYTVGGVSATASVGVTADMTWQQTLTAIARGINMSTDTLHADVLTGTRTTGLDDPFTADGVYLEVSLASPKRGERLVLDEYGGPWLADVKGIYDNEVSLSPLPLSGDRWIAGSTANGWTKDHIYEFNGSTWDETVPTAYNAVTSDADASATDLFFDGTSWSTTPAGSLLGTIGMTATATPGADAQARIEGREYVSETGTFSQDEGRFTAHVTGSASGVTMPLRVVEGMQEVQTRVEDILTAYNDLRALLLPNQDLLEPGFADSWQDPLSAQANNLEWMGVRQTTKDGTLWAQNDTFWSALGQDPERVRLTFLDAEYGIVPALQRVAELSRTPSLLDRLVSPESLEDPSPATSETMPIYKNSLLQRTMDTLTQVERPKQSPYLELTGLLDDIITTKRAALEEPLTDSGSILKTSG